MQNFIIFPTIALALGYCLGAIPFAVIIARRHGVDILKAGSGNPGATNVKRTCGKKAGNTVFALDAVKGFLAAFLPSLLPLSLAGSAENADSFAQVVAVSQLAGFAGAVLGHCFSVFLKFKGGKGVSTTVGALLGAMPIAVVIGGIVWAAVYFPTRVVAIASIALGISLPATTFLLSKFAPALGYGEIQIGFCVVIMIFIIAMHHSNIRRLLKGEENAFKKK